MLSVKCISPLIHGSPFGTAGKSGILSRPILTFPEEPLILKFFTFFTKEGGRNLSSTSFKKVRFTSALETIFDE